ncbi:protein kinase [Vitiosangium sp. GDMCC 1.1324]|uniref:protein kinase domain-containing protein n=1 Tax=Vitiosangium sp. (strain GDMCC 1.1324) TaxID=2138576 RepID=UPI000D3B0A9E|nr:protein kinase [Vitiosangium sp. GDMCC 1.1324]PTL84741.1 serine/threonine protein kinase [Vitiosangium sp. GDMCC 1.1324]
MAPNEAREFGKYELVSKLAAGGMAVTYRARMKGAAGVTKPVVIKQILPHFADDPAFVEMFVSEARVAAALTHGNIAQVFDFGEIDGQYFLAMEFVHGQPLSKLLRRALKAGLPSLPLPLALYIGTQICDGLDYAHRHVGEDGHPMGLVHRDVSPDNVLISYEGQVKVIDFGIAKATSVVEARTSPGTLKGKFPYFSTEQARGEQDLDARSDIFAVGVVLYEMLCGRRPYEGEFAAVLPRIIAGDFPPPSSLNPAIDPGLESVMYTAMALDRETRYPTAQAFSEALREQLYSAYPRFSPAMLSQLLGHLFAEDLAAEGRRVEVTPGFLEQLAAWQSQTAGETSGSHPRPPATGPGSSSGRPSTGSGVRAVQRPGSDGGRPVSGSTPRPAALRPSTNGASGRPPSDGSGRTLSSASGRRVTSSTGVRAQAAPSTMAAPPELGEEEAPTSVSAPPAGARAAEPAHDTPVEVPAVSVPAKVTDPLRAHRETQTREEQERAERRQRLVMLISVPIFGLTLVLGGLHYFLGGKGDSSPVGSLWLTSAPAGASVKLNGKDVPGVTPLVVPNVPLHQANTLVLTLPGYRPWTKRFTANTEAEPPVHAELERAEPAPTAPPAPPAPTAVVTPPALEKTGDPQPEAAAGTTAEAAAAAPAPEAAEKPGTPAAPDPKYNVVDYPTRLFVLRPQYNAFPVGRYSTASIELNPGSSYSINTDGGASVGGRGGASSTLAYLAEGDNLATDDTFGLIGPSPRTFKGVRRLYVFLLDDDLADNSGSVRVHLRQSKWVAPRQLTFDATHDALVLQPEHQFVLRRLNPDATYLLTVRDDFAELRSGANGRTHRVLCAESSTKSARRNHRLLEAGKRYQLTGADTLRCTFPDTRVEDNQGAFEVDIVDVTEMSRRERAAALRGASR